MISTFKYESLLSPIMDHSLNRQPLPSISLGIPLADALEIRSSNQGNTLYLDGTSIVSYRPRGEYIGKAIEIPGDLIEGSLFFNTDFFKKFENLTKHPTSKSEMVNLAKTFFRINGKNHVALVQFLESDSSSGEHYHELEEVIVQLAGRSYIELRPEDREYQHQTLQLDAGTIYTIPPRHLHRVYTREEDVS